MNPLLKLILMAAVILICSKVGAQVNIDNAMLSGVKITSRFIFDSETQTITGYNGLVNGHLVVPQKIAGVQVLHIGTQALRDKDITSLELPEGLLTIGAEAFMNNRINVVQLPDSLVYVELGAFGILDGVSAGTTHVALSGNPTYRGATFQHNRNLTSISGLHNVPKIPFLMFGGCRSLVQVQMHTGTWDNPSLDGNNYGLVQSIGESAFVCTNISTITLPNSCKSVARAAFATIPGISRVTLPANVAIADETSFNQTDTLSQASFKAAYEAGGSLAGTYEYIEGSWVKTH